MWKGLCAGAMALAAVSTSLVVAEAAVHSRAHAGMALRGGAVNARIAHARAVLKLTPAQARQWAPVEAALRAMLRQQGGAANVDSAQMVRLTSAAMPLIMSLDETQKRDARRLAHAMGLEQVASLF
jgi:hypothetical protein